MQSPAGRTAHRFVSSSIFVRLVGFVAASAVAFACSSSSSSSGGPGASSGGAGADGGTDGSASGGTPGTSGPPLPTTTFLYARAVATDRDWLIARDLKSGAERTVTDLTGDGSPGWDMAGHTLSKDRTRIAISSLYGPTSADTATLIATRRIWTFDTEGKDFARLTPVFKNPQLGTPGYRIDVRTPAFSADGRAVFYTYGEGTVSQPGITRTWAVPTAAGSAPPTLLDTPAACSIASVPSVDPATGRLMLIQDICPQTPADEGFVLVAADGKTELLGGFGGLSVNYEQPRWAADGSLFLFSAYPKNTGGAPSSLYAFVLQNKSVVEIVKGAADQSVVDGALSPDGNYIVYCVRNGAARNLRLLDLTKEPPVDTAMTTDGASCHPVF